jgi:hypothetical protein
LSATGGVTEISIDAPRVRLMRTLTERFPALATLLDAVSIAVDGRFTTTPSCGAEPRQRNPSAATRQRRLTRHLLGNANPVPSSYDLVHQHANSLDDRPSCRGLLGVVFVSAQRPLEIYYIDVEGGGATLFVSSGESLLVDAGNPGGRDVQQFSPS